MSCIHYKFKSSLDYNSVTFDGLHLSLGDLKKAISAQKRLKAGEFELEIINASTGDVYKKADELIAKNTSVIVSRVPINKSTANSTQRSWEAFKQECAKVKEKERQALLEKQKQAQEAAAAAAVSVPSSEIDKIKAVIDQSTKGFEPSSMQGRHPSAVPSDHYVCKKCGKKGHFVSNCPNVKPEDRVVEQRLKRTTGIPSTMLTLVDDPLHPGALLTNQGHFAVPTVDVEGYKESKKDRPPFLPGESQPPEPDKIIPKELLCHICEDLCVDAAIAPCCGTSFCDECLRGELLDSEDHQCPSCHESNVSPDRIVANRSMRIAVTNFLNDSGYTKVKRRRSSSASGEAGPRQPFSSLSASDSMPVNSFSDTKPQSAIPISSALNSVTSTGHEKHKTDIQENSNQNANSSQQIERINSHYDKPWNRYEPRYDRHNGPRMSKQDKYYGGPNFNSWNSNQNRLSHFIATTTHHPPAVAVAAAAQVVQAALAGQQRLPPPPFAGMRGYPDHFMGARHQRPHAQGPPAGPPVNMLHPQPVATVKKAVDVFESFADFTKKKSRTPELISRSRSRSPSQHRGSSHSFSPNKKDSHGRSPRRSFSRSRSRSYHRRSRSGSRSPAASHRSQKRSRTRSPVKRRSRSRESRGLSELRSISPVSPSKRSKTRSPSPLRSYVKKASKSPPRSPWPLRSPSRSRSKSLKKSYRSRSRSWSRSKKGRSRSYSPLSSRRSPRRSPGRSPLRSSQRSPHRSPGRSPKRFGYSPARSKRSYTPRRRSQSASPRRSSLRSKSRSPFSKRRPAFSRSRSPPRKRSFSPSKNRRSPSPYRYKKPRSPSPFQNRAGGGFRDGGRTRDRYYSSPPRHSDSTAVHHAGSGTIPPLLPTQQPHNPNAGVPYLPPPEEYFKDNRAGYEEFMRTIYAQFGSQVPWNVPPGQPPAHAPLGNQYPPNQPYVPPPTGYTQDRRPWESGPISAPRPPRPNSPQRRTNSYSPKFGERFRRDGGKPDFERGREKERRYNDQRYDDRMRRGDYNFKDKKMEDRRVESKDRKMFSDARDRRGEREAERSARDWERNKGDKGRDAGKSKEHGSTDRKKSPDRRKSPQHDSKSSDKTRKTEDRKKGERKKEEKENQENKAQSEAVNKATNNKEQSETKMEAENPHADAAEGKPKIVPLEETSKVKNENTSETTDVTASQEKVEVKKAAGKKKAGAAGTKKLKAKNANAVGGEKKEKKIKKKKLTFGASETDNKGLKKKKLKRVVDYKSEINNAPSEDTDLEKNSLSEPSPSKKVRLEPDGTMEVDQKAGPVSDGEPPQHQPKAAPAEPAATAATDSRPVVAGDVEGEVAAPATDDKDKPGVLTTELPELSKWERDDFEDDMPVVEKEKVDDKPKEKPLPRSVVDKAEKFLVEKPMKNSVIAASVASVEANFDAPERPKDGLDKSKNGSERHKEGLHRLKDKDTTDKRDDRHKFATSDKARDFYDDRREEFDRGNDRRKDYRDPRPKSPLHLRDYKSGNVKDYHSKSPPYKDFRSKSPVYRDHRPKSPLRMQDYRSKSPMRSRDYRSKSPVRSRDHRSKSPAHKDHHSRSPPSHRDNRPKSPLRAATKDTRSKSPVGGRSRKVYVDSKKDSRDSRKTLDIQITVKGDRHKKGAGRNLSEEDERSVVKSQSLERELKKSKTHKEKENSKEYSSKEKKVEKESKSSKSVKTKDKAPETKKKSKPAKESEEAPKKSPRDLRHKIDEKTRSQSVAQRKLSVVDESEFVPDYEDLGLEASAGDKETPSSPHKTSSPERAQDGKRKLEEKTDEELDEDNEEEDGKSAKADSVDKEVSGKHKKSKKKHKKKEKKEKHKHKKKKHKQKSKERDVDN